MISIASPRHIVADPRAGQVLWLVRHGETDWNAAGLAQGQCDQARLTGRGVRQAWGVVGQLCHRPITALYASDLHRAMETAAPLASVLGLAVSRDARLRERCLGAVEGTATAAISPAVTGLRENRVADPDARPAGGESLRDLYRRVAAFAVDLAARRLPGGGARAGDVLVVAHGGTLRVLDAYLRGVPVERMSWEPLANGCILRWPDPALIHETPRHEKGRTTDESDSTAPAAAGRQTARHRAHDGDRRRDPAGYFTDLVSSAAEYIDFVKFGWGTAVVTGDLRAKIEVLRAKDIGFYFGGTLFEKYVLQGRFDDFRKFCQQHSCRHVEVSNGTIPMSNSEKASYIRKLADDFTVVSEVGFKDPRPLRAAAAEHVGRVHQRGSRSRGIAGHPRGQGEREVRHLPAGRRAAVRADRGRAGLGNQPGKPALRGAHHRPAGALHHPARARRQPRATSQRMGSSAWRPSASGCGPTR